MDQTPPKDRNWPKDLFGRWEVFSQLWLFSGWALIAAIIAGLVLLISSLFRNVGKVVVYCAQDQVYAEPIFHEFEKETGIKVAAVFDSEAVKTVGMANRLLAERRHPQCDVFWGNEEMRTRQLAAQNVFRETNGWAPFGYRSRRMGVNTNVGQMAAAPRSLVELTNPSWRGRV